MIFDKDAFLRSVLTERRRKAVPIMTSPGIALLGAKAADVFQNGDLQFRCIRALSEFAPVDAQVTFMDLSIEAEAFGCEIVLSDHDNPTVAAPLAVKAAEIKALPVPPVGVKRTGEILNCARLCAVRLERPTFAGMIGPFSLAGRIAGMSEMMMMAASEPDTAHALLQKTSDFLGAYAKALKNTGVAGLLIAEPAAGLLSPEMCREFAVNYLMKIIQAVNDSNFMAILHNCGRTEKQVDTLLSTGADALHVGNAVDIGTILPQMPETVLLLGNLDPANVCKNMTASQVAERTLMLLKQTAPYKNHVFSTGCDLPGTVPLENIQAFLGALKAYNDKNGE
jgi:uroporphyrinogen decarboxylase